ncbi:MAG: proline racemase family protein [Gemmatimonadetes bacterium]|nr:proline racemase family protein [Gemmatimonadota bacterium]
MTALDWPTPEGCRVVRTIDAHAQGEPLRIITAGFPQPAGNTVLERRRDARERLDAWRTALMWEPRGHADMYGCLVMPPVLDGSHFSVLFLHNDGFSTMCGHGIIAVSTVAAEAGLGDPEASSVELAIDTPAGLVRSTVEMREGRADRVRFRNVLSFAVELDQLVAVPGLGEVRFDLAFGGAYYAYVDAGAMELELTPRSASRLIDAGRRIKAALSADRTIEHPVDDDLGFLYGVIFTGPAASPGHHSRHVCVFADGEVDRSPTGTGVSGWLALLDARGQLAEGEEIRIESLIGSRFSGRIVGRDRIGGRPAITPEVGGRAYVTGRHEFLIDPDDPWRDGFSIR